MKLGQQMVQKPWGRDSLPAPFIAPQGQRVGEIWFEPPSSLDSLLVKYLFTSDKLSVQVHPSNDQAEAAGLGRKGKEECWLVVDAQPGAALGIGLQREISADALRAAALDGSIEQMLAWHKVAAGDFFYIPAGTIHAIGGGVSLIEIQQNSDITYRLYDYGRPRDLHLDEAVEVAKRTVHDAGLRRSLPKIGAAQLVEGPYFRLDYVVGAPDTAICARYEGGPLLAIALEGRLRVDGEDIAPGEVVLAPSLAVLGCAGASQYLLTQPCRAD